MSDEPTNPTAVPEGARCAIHPDRSAEHTCARCGNYMCTECASGAGADICATCASRLGAQGAAFPFSRDHYTFEGLFKLSLSRWKEHWPLVVGSFTGFMFLAYAITLGGEWAFELVADASGPASPLHSPLHPARLLFQLVITLLEALGQLVLFGIYVDILQGRAPDGRAALRRLEQAPNALLLVIAAWSAFALYAGLHVGVFFAFGGLSGGLNGWIAVAVVWVVTLPVVIYLGLGVMFSTLALVVAPESNALTAIRISWNAVSGHRFEALGISLAAGVIAFLGILACCVGILATFPFATMLYCALFLALRNERVESTA